MSIYWWFWFSPNSRDDRRRVVISALLGTIVALFVARALAGVLPFRARPIFTTGIDYHPPILLLQENLAAEDWSSFPSDHGAMWFALVYGCGACPVRLALPLPCSAPFGYASSESIWGFTIRPT